MQIVIVVLLAIIALSVAPWLFAVVVAAVAAVAAYGVFWIATIAVAAVALIGYALFLMIFGVRRRERIQHIERVHKSCRNFQMEMPVKATICSGCGATNQFFLYVRQQMILSLTGW